MTQQVPSIGRRVHYLDGTTHLTADICPVYPDQVVDLYEKDQGLGATYFRYAVPFDAAAEAGMWHWLEAVPPTADVGLLVPPAVPMVPGGDAPMVV